LTRKLNIFLIQKKIKGIEDLCTKRDDLQRQIMVEEEEKHKLQNDIRVLSEKLAKTNEGLAKKISARNEFDKTIAETEAAYMKVNSTILLIIIVFAPMQHPFFADFVFWENSGNKWSSLDLT
jgi:hypothetical protein